MAKFLENIFFIGPMSLGDCFVVNGLAHYFGDRCNELHYPVRPVYFKTIQSLYRNFPHIKVVALDPLDGGENQYVEEHKLVRLTRADPLVCVMINGVIVKPLWDEQLYNNYDLPFSIRYSHAKIPEYVEGANELYQKLSGGNPYIIVNRLSGEHPDGIPIDIAGFRRSVGLPDLPIIEITEGITDDMMQYIHLIQNAAEIHTVPTGFFHLVDSMYNRTNAKLFYHDARASTLIRINCSWNKYRWTVVAYENKQ
jgi:hypothetical protein